MLKRIHDFSLGNNFLEIFWKAQATEIKIDKLDCIKPKTSAQQRKQKNKKTTHIL